MRKNRNRLLKNFKFKFTEETEKSSRETIADRKHQLTLMEEFLLSFKDLSDLMLTEFQHLNLKIYYFEHLIDKNRFEQLLTKIRKLSKEQLQDYIRQSEFRLLEDATNVEATILNGDGILFVNEVPYELPYKDGESRAITASETESVILGAHDAFVESLDVNLSLIRRRLMSPKLKAISLQIGNIGKNTVYLLYIDDLIAKDDLEDLKNRLKTVKKDAIADTNMLVQYIDEHPNSPFPQFFTTERPDVTVYKLLEGKIVGLFDNSPYAFCTPVSFFDFMESMDDFGQRWIVSTFIRATRYAAILVTLMFTALYVSVTTFHYEMIPQALLPTLIESRSRVPFPPVIEALFLEFLLELLREAGARLPSKVGQTIGIVGGIVIGQAAVEAGITSNILIIVVAASAIASFVVPSYLMSTSIRIVRFGFILVSGFWGNIGLVFGMGILIIHLAGLTNLNAPYLLPLSPTYVRFFKYSLIRGPLKKNTERR
ncbi:MAG: spore germination protein [Neobacillus sp.]